MVDIADPSEPNEANEPTDPIDSTEPTDPIESSESLEAMDSTERRDRIDHGAGMGSSCTTAPPRRSLGPASLTTPVGGR